MTCQVFDVMVRDELPCKAEESGGIQCERLWEHGDDHWISDHTIHHYQAGNGYWCEAIT